MAGGTWLSQNKVRPGAYINFKAVQKGSMTVGDRGIIAIPLSLHWGDTDGLIEILSSEMLDGNSKAKVGFTAFDPESKLLAAALSYCYKALVYRTDREGIKAAATIGKLKCEAKYFGTYGNKIIVATTLDDELWTVITYVDGETMDKQVVSEIAELADNDFVRFSRDAEAVSDTDFVESAGTPLTGGTDGVSVEVTAYPDMMSKLDAAKWQTLACPTSETTIKANVQKFIKRLRDDEGRYVQAVVADYDGADHEGIINSISGAVIDGLTFTKEEFTAIVAGMTAGANFNESNTAREIIGATDIIGRLTDAQIKEALGRGKFLLSASTDGTIKVEQDINSLHTYTKDKSYSFSKNRVIRTLDEIGTTTVTTWEKTYMGKVDNNATGRSLFKADLVAYGNEMQRLSGIQEFAGPDDISVEQGKDLDSVLATWACKPTDAMEKLYMECHIRS